MMVKRTELEADHIQLVSVVKVTANTFKLKVKRMAPVFLKLDIGGELSASCSGRFILP